MEKSSLMKAQKTCCLLNTNGHFLVKHSKPINHSDE